MGEEAKVSEARCHPDRMVVYAAGRWSESHVSYPGRSVVLPECYRLCKGLGWDNRSQLRP